MFYYISRGKIYTSRFKLLESLKRDPYPYATLYFQDHEFAKYDWKTEPEETIDELYRQRAQQLRDKYDYLVLMFSGGADSNNILQTFLRNNIHLDEIVSMIPLKIIQSLKDNIFINGLDLGILFEYEKAMLPRLREVSLYHPRTKVSIIDISEYIARNYNQDNFYTDNPDSFTLYHTYLAMRQVYESTELQSSFAHHGSFACLYGCEKPLFALTGMGKLGMHFNDFFTYYNWSKHAVPFYWDVDAVKLLIKQGHLFKRFLDNKPSIRKNFSGEFYSNQLLDSPILKKIIYPSTFESDIFQGTKAKDDNIIIHAFGETQKNHIKELKDKLITGGINTQHLFTLKDGRIVFTTRLYELE